MKTPKTAVSPPTLDQQVRMTRRVVREFGSSNEHRQMGRATVAFLRDQAVGISPAQRAAIDAGTEA
jgi:hypothetical protein